MSNPYPFGSDGVTRNGLTLPQLFNNLVQQAYQMATPMIDSPSIAQVQTVGPGENFQFTMESIDTADDAVDHVDGALLNGRGKEYVRGVIGIDPILADARELGERDIQITDIPALQGVASSLVNSLKMKYENRFNQLHVRAARSTSLTKGGRIIHNGGNTQRIVGSDLANALPDSSTGADRFDEAAHVLAQTLDARFIPRGGRIMRISTYVARILRHRPSLFLVDYKSINNVNARIIAEIAGFQVVVDPNLDTLTGVKTDAVSKYSVDCTIGASTGQPVALISCGAMEGKAPIGIAKKVDITGEYEWKKDRFVHYFNARMLQGMDIMHPYCAGSIEVRSS